MQYKTLLLASFVDKTQVPQFLINLKEKYNIERTNVFIYELTHNSCLLTFKLKVDVGSRFEIKKELPKTIQIHKKQSTFFTINALNKLIERDSGLMAGNINHKEYKVDWSNYEDKLILLRGDMLDISDIKRVFLPNP